MSKKFKSALRIILILLIVIMLLASAWVVLYFYDFSNGHKPILGVTFSKSYAKQLDLDWRQTYLAILDDLQVKNLRLVAQWDEIEPQFNEYYFADLDWQITEAAKREAQVILAIGRRTPRWPECHDPLWLKDLPEQKILQEQLQMIQKTVEHFKQYDNVSMWQVENEPFLTIFGQCPVIPLEQVKKEIALVKSLDLRPVMVTDSGELSYWLQTANLADKFGHTLYRVVYSETLFSYLYYYLPPAYYHAKAKLNGLKKQNVLISELQAEPWVPQGYTLQLDYQKMLELMDPQKMQSNIDFAIKTGAAEIYLWGVEWWYWLKINQNDDCMWQVARQLFL